MKGYVDYNFAAFDQAASLLRSEGHMVRNPAEMSRQIGLTHPEEIYMRQDFQAILQMDAIHLLPDWEYSSGAIHEVIVARKLKLPIYDSQTGGLMPEDLLDLYAGVMVQPRPDDFVPKTGKMLSSVKCG